jgi:hypothetical protein
MYEVNGDKMLVIGAAVKASPELLKVFYHNTATSTTQVGTFDYSSAYSSIYSVNPSTSTRQAIRHLSYLYVDGANDAIYGSTDEVESGASGLGIRRLIFRITGPGGVGTTVKILDGYFTNVDEFLALQAVGADQVGLFWYRSDPIYDAK